MIVCICFVSLSSLTSTFFSSLPDIDPSGYNEQPAVVKHNISINNIFFFIDTSPLKKLLQSAFYKQKPHTTAIVFPIFVKTTIMVPNHH